MVNYSKPRRRRNLGYLPVTPVIKATLRERIEDGQLREEVEYGLSKYQAIDLGRRLYRRMQGTGWMLRVWQNLGWHYAVSCGPLTLYPATRPGGCTTYHTLMSDDPKETSSGAMIFHTQTEYDDPNKAVRAQLQFASETIARLQLAYMTALLAATPGALPGPMPRRTRVKPAKRGRT